MKLIDILYDNDILNVCETVYVCDATGEILTEGAIRQFKRTQSGVTRKYRCTAGKKKGKLVSTPSACSQRPDPKKVRQGRKTMRAKKGIISRKGAISKRKAMSRVITRLNKRLAGN